MCVSQVSMLYTLNLHSAVCQLYLNKNGRKRKNEIQKKREKEDWTWVSWIGEQKRVGCVGKEAYVEAQWSKAETRRAWWEGEGILKPSPNPSTVFCPCRTTPKLPHISILPLEIRGFARTNSGKFWFCETQQKKQLHIKAWLRSLSSVQSLSHAWLFVTPWTVACQASLSITNSWSLLKLTSRWHGKLMIRWHPTISSSVIPFSSCLQPVPTSGFFPMSQFFASGGQTIGVSASASVLPMNTQDWSPLGWTGWISLQPKGLSRVFSNTTVQKHQFFKRSAFFIVQLSHPYMTTGKTMLWLDGPLSVKEYLSL